MRVCSPGEDEQGDPQDGKGEDAEETEEVSPYLPPTARPGGSSTAELPPGQSGDKVPLWMNCTLRYAPLFSSLPSFKR
jgi:hypothetical protein